MASILIVGKYYPPYNGGTETYTRDVCEELARRHRVTAVVHHDQKFDVQEVMNGVHVVRCGTQFVWNSQPISWSMLRHIRLEEIDLIHFQAPNFFANAILLLKRMMYPRIPIVITHHMEVHGRRFLRAAAIPLYRSLARRSAAIIVTSRKNALLSKDLPQDVTTTCIPLGISLEEFQLRDGEATEAMAWKRDIVGSAPTIAFVGRHARYKGLDVLLDAVATIPGLHALIAGDGAHRVEAQSRSIRLGLGERVHFLGNLSQLRKRMLLAACDVFVLPSTETTEAFGISLLEAMSAGVPVVASDLPTGVTDVAIHEKTALLARPGDPASLASCINRLLTDRTLRETLRNSAYEHLQRSFSKADVLARTVDLLESHLKPSRPREVLDRSFELGDRSF